MNNVSFPSLHYHSFTPLSLYDETHSSRSGDCFCSSDRQTPCNLTCHLDHTFNFANTLWPLLIEDIDQHLADKYAHGDPQISSTLAKLQLPQDFLPSTPDRAGFVPLPQPGQTLSKQQTAVAIRDGRRAAQYIAELGGRSLGSTASGKSASGSSSNLRYSARKTSLSTVLEQDFTVQGKKGSLLCPFSRPRPTALTLDGAKMDTEVQTPPGSGQDSDTPLTPPDVKDTTPHHSADPICAAMYAETTASAPSVTGSAAKCPIRYLDQHSPEEVAAYFETHKHEIPRSHEICVRRYQRNESDIRKLDAKYGSLVNMIQGLGQKHQPLLPSKEEEDFVEMEHVSNEMVENWAQAVSADGVGEPDAVEPVDEGDSDRESRFDRPFKEIRVGESPSRPWGISVPVFDPPDGQRPVSPSPAPVSINHMPKSTGKCPFGHGQEKEEKSIPYEHEARPVGKCPFSAQVAKTEEEIFYPASNEIHIEEDKPKSEAPFQQPPVVQQPTFFNSPQAMMGAGPQMVFTGPVFIGYPIEQAMAFMQQYKGT